MAYITAVTDWTASDYLNVADFARIYGNVKLVTALAEIEIDDPVVFNTIATPTTAINPATILSIINTLLANIERLRLAVASLSIPGTASEIQQWLAGASVHSPDYIDVNLWESTIDAIWEYFDGPALEVCPTLTADLTIPTDTQYLVVDCIDPDEFEIIIQGTGELFVI